MVGMIFLLGFLFIGFSSSPLAAESGVSDKEILIGSCSDHTTDTQKVRTEIRLQGVKSYFEYINDLGGVYGRKIKLLEKDDAYDPGEAILCFRKLMDANVFAGAFFIGGPTAAKYAPLGEKNHIPVIGFVAGSNFLYDPVKKYVFAVRGSYLDMIEGTVGKLLAKGPHRVGIIFQEDAFGGGAYEALRIVLKKRSMEPVVAAGVLHGSADIDKAMAQLKAGRPDVIVIALVSEPSAAVLAKSREMEWKPIFISITNNPLMFKLAGKAMNGVVLPEVVPTADRTDLPAIAQYQKLVKKRFPKAKLNATGVEGFAEAKVIVEGLKRAGRELTREGFVAALESMKDVDLGFGPKFKVTFGPDDHQAFQEIYPTVVRNGKPVLIDDWSKITSGS